MASNETAKPNIVRFVFDVGKPENFFTLYLGSITTALFVLIFIIALIRKRSYSIVIQLAKPDTDAHVHEYSILLKTSYKIGAGLTEGARVAVQLIGTYCDSKRFTLTQKLMRQKILHRAHVDIFILYTPMDIGEIKQIRFTLFNFSDQEIVKWRPCFVEVMKSTSRERWAITVEEGLETHEKTTQTYSLIKGAREEVSIFKLFVRHHQLTAPFFNPARVGVFTTFANIMFVFFSQTTLLMSTMSVFVLANTFLGKLISEGDFLRQFFADFFPFTQLTAAVVAAMLQQLELLLNNMRPCPNAKTLTYWRGLWRNDHNPNLMHCNVEYEWDRSPNRFKPLVTRFSSKTSLSSVDSSEESPESSLDESSEEEDMDTEEIKRNQAGQAEANSLKMIRHCVRLSKSNYAYAERPDHQVEKNPLDVILVGELPYYVGDRAVLGCRVEELTIPLPRASCQFCLWVKHFSVRGEDLHSYATSMSHHMRRSIQAVQVTKNAKTVTRLLTLCIDQLVGSLTSHMLREAVTTMESMKMDLAGIDMLLKELRESESNLWFAEEGHKEGPLAGANKDDKTHMISNMYFTIMRHLIQTWKSSRSGIKGILKKPNDDLAPAPEGKRRGIRWDTKVHKKDISKVSDIIEALDVEEKNQQEGTEKVSKVKSRRASVALPFLWAKKEDTGHQAASPDQNTNALGHSQSPSSQPDTYNMLSVSSTPTSDKPQQSVWGVPSSSARQPTGTNDTVKNMSNSAMYQAVTAKPTLPTLSGCSEHNAWNFSTASVSRSMATKQSPVNKTSQWDSTTGEKTGQNMTSSSQWQRVTPKQSPRTFSKSSVSQTNVAKACCNDLFPGVCHATKPPRPNGAVSAQKAYFANTPNDVVLDMEESSLAVVDIADSSSVILDICPENKGPENIAKPVDPNQMKITETEQRAMRGMYVTVDVTSEASSDSETSMTRSGLDFVETAQHHLPDQTSRSERKIDCRARFKSEETSTGSSHHSGTEKAPADGTREYENSDSRLGFGRGQNKCNSSVYPASSDSDNELDPLVFPTKRSNVQMPYNAGSQPQKNHGRLVHQAQRNLRRSSAYSKTKAGFIGAWNHGNSNENKGGGSAQAKNLRGRTAKRKDSENISNSNKSEKSMLGFVRRKSMALTNTLSTKMVEMTTTAPVMPAGPTTINEMCNELESYAEMVELEVKSGKRSCCCCSKKLCQTYAMVFVQLREYVYRVLYQFLAHNVVRKHDEAWSTAVIAKRVKDIQHNVHSFIENKCQLMKRMGKGENQEKLEDFMEAKSKSLKVQEQSLSHSYGSLDSFHQWDVQMPTTSGEMTEGRAAESTNSVDGGKSKPWYAGFKFGKRQEHHGVISNWTHKPFPFSRAVMPPIKLIWPRRRVVTTPVPQFLFGSDVDAMAKLRLGGAMGAAEDESPQGSSEKAVVSSAAIRPKLVPVSTAKSKTSSDSSDNESVQVSPEKGITSADSAVDVSRNAHVDPSSATVHSSSDSVSTTKLTQVGSNVDASAAETSANTMAVPGEIAHPVPMVTLIGPDGTCVDAASAKVAPEQAGSTKGFLKALIHKSLWELKTEVEWVVGLKESLAAVVAFSRLDIAKELEDPLKLAVRHFTHALLILLYEGLLPKADEENFTVSPDDIRQRRKRVSSNRTPGLFDLTEKNNPGYDLNVLDFVVVKLHERWDMAKVEYQYTSTMMFLSRCLVMANLDMSAMVHLEDAVLARPGGGLHGMTMENVTHIHETQHKVASVISEVMALTLSYVIPETLKAMDDVAGWLRNEEERVMYVCERVTVLEYQVRHKLSRRVMQAATQQVQDKMMTLAQRREANDTREQHMLNKLRSLVKEEEYEYRVSTKELAPIKKELKEIRYMLNTIARVNQFEQARAVGKYAKKTRKEQHFKTKNTLVALTDVRSKEHEYTDRQYAEVEWVVTKQMDKRMPSFYMSFAMTIMCLGTLFNLLFVTVLGASFTPFSIGEWFGLHGLAMAMIIFISEPFKCIWHYDFGWKQPQKSDFEKRKVSAIDKDQETSYDKDQETSGDKDQETSGDKDQETSGDKLGPEESGDQ